MLAMKMLPVLMLLVLPCLAAEEIMTQPAPQTEAVDIMTMNQDARCHQVYNALFRVHAGEITRLCEDRALSIDDLAAECKEFNETVILVGDGASLCAKDPAFAGTNIVLAPEAKRQQRASSVALAAWHAIQNREDTISPAEIAPLYLRLPQAERELKARTLKK